VELGETLADFEVDVVVVTRAGGDPTEPAVLYGSPSLFQRFYTRARTGRFPATTTPDLTIASMGPKQAHADAAVPSLDFLVQRGADLFFNENFNGNGRTCGTCHPAENNLTIDPKFIASLRHDDPLFVAEFVPALRENFEKPELMRGIGLILDNTNGFGDLANDFTMRGVPHTLALITSLEPAPATGGPDPVSGLTPAADGTTLPPLQRTGWSGDGAAGSGTLREFALGAVTQHFPKTLTRLPGVDFRLPNDDELDAMEAFQLFLGRQEDPDIAALRFTSPVVARGRDVFSSNSEGKCNACHRNAGANIAGGFNFNFDTGVEDLPDQPANLIDGANNRPDNGFGGNPGNGTFNTPSLIEAADTGPFFHNNSIETIEGAVAFYNSEAFNDSPAAAGLAAITGSAGINLETTQIVAASAFLRVMNSLENIRSARDTAEFTLDVKNFRTAKDLLKLALAETADGEEVLLSGGLHPEAQQSLARARKLLVTASLAHSRIIRNGLIQRALKRLEQARRLMVQG